MVFISILLFIFLDAQLKHLLFSHQYFFQNNAVYVSCLYQPHRNQQK
jgi:hypothetical protein